MSVINGDTKNWTIIIIVLIIIPYITGLPVNIVIKIITAESKQYSAVIVNNDIPNKLFFIIFYLTYSLKIKTIIKDMGGVWLNKLFYTINT